MKFNFGLVAYKAWSTLVSESSRSYLRFLWWFLEPLFMMSVYFLVFSMFLNIRSDDYIEFLLVGLVAWQWFNTAVSSSINSIFSSGNVISRIAISKLFFPSVSVTIASIKFFFVASVLLLLLVVWGYHINSSWMFLPLVLIVQFFFILACSYWVALTTPFIPDLQIIFNTLLLGGMFASGVFYSPDVVPEAMREYFFMNPMAVLINDYRMILLDQVVPELKGLIIIFFISACLLVAAVFFMRRFNNLYIRMVVRP